MKAIYETWMNAEQIPLDVGAEGSDSAPLATINPRRNSTRLSLTRRIHAALCMNHAETSALRLSWSTVFTVFTRCLASWQTLQADARSYVQSTSSHSTDSSFHSGSASSASSSSSPLKPATVPGTSLALSLPLEDGASSLARELDLDRGG
jgi:hypothetical protein